MDVIQIFFQQKEVISYYTFAAQIFSFMACASLHLARL